MAAKLSFDLYEIPGGGDNSLSPVIFLHGMTATKEDWSSIPQAIAHKTGRKVYNVDARNHGESEYTKEFNFDHNTGDLFHFMDSNNIARAVLVGHSMGGITAIKAALQKPERIDMVFVEDMHTKKLSKEVFGAISEFITLWNISLRHIPEGLHPIEAVASAKDYFCHNLLNSSQTSFFSEEDVRKWFIKLKASPGGGYVSMFNTDAIMEASKNLDLIMTESSGQFNGPAFFMYGTRSQFEVDKEEEHIKKHFPKMELIKFEGATHEVHCAFPDEFLKTILQRLT